MVKDAYDEISLAYGESRGGALALSIVERVKALLKEAPRLILDIGAGGGGNLRVLVASLDGSCYVGCELSLGMIKRSGVGIDWVNCSATHMPIRASSIDLAISLATLHHIPKQLVGNVLQGVFKVLKPHGLFVASVWACDENTLRILRRLNGCEGFIGWSHGLGRRVERYYRLYRRGELEDEVSGAGFNIVESGVVKVGRYSNFYVVASRGGYRSSSRATG